MTVHKGGRPAKKIDYEQLEKLCAMLCTGEECAAMLGMTYETLNNKLKQEGHDGFLEYYKRHSAQGKSSLRRLQWKSANKGNVTMQIWLGKQILGQCDKRSTELTGKGGGPIEAASYYKPDLSKLSDEELKELEYLLDRADAESSAISE